jgi:hypothetical protein
MDRRKAGVEPVTVFRSPAGVALPMEPQACHPDGGATAPQVCHPDRGAIAPTRTHSITLVARLATRSGEKFPRRPHSRAGSLGMTGAG